MMHIYESAEDYLEAILMLQEKNGHVRSIDVANMLNFSKPRRWKARRSPPASMSATGC